MKYQEAQKIFPQGKEKMMDKGDFRPELITIEGARAYGLMMVELHRCPICSKWMLYKEVKRWEGTPFPRWVKIDFDAQLKKAGWVTVSQVKVDDHHICDECASAGKADFLCALCGKRKPTSEIQERFGDPSEFLCKQCYETVPAKQWEEKVESLEADHRWDFD